MNIVPRVGTPLGKDETRRAVLAAWSSVRDENPTADELALVLALVWIETGAGKSCKNWNLGNITASSSYSGDAWRPPWFDEPTDETSARDRALHADMKAGRAPSAFRAYQTIEQGALDFVRVLSRDFPEVIDAAKRGDPDTFRNALAQKYSGDYKNASATITLASFMRQFGGSPKAVVAAGGLSSLPVSPSSASSLPVLRRGSSGSAVELWEMLAKVQKAPGLVGVYVMGDATIDATKFWQGQRGLVPDGIVGPKTWGRALSELSLKLA